MTKTTTIETTSLVVQGANSLKATAGTSGQLGSSWSQGCKTYLALENVEKTSWTIVVNSTNGDRTIVDQPASLAITLSGGSELQTIIKALEFMAKALREEAQARVADSEGKHD